MPAWIHDRAMSLKKDMEKTYGPKKAEQVAFAVATQQAHRLGKSPKKFKSKVTGKMERFGTSRGRAMAKAKFDKPKDEYIQKAAALDEVMIDAFLEELDLIKEAAKQSLMSKAKGAWNKGREEGFIFLKKKHQPKQKSLPKHMRGPIFDMNYKG